MCVSVFAFRAMYNNVKIINGHQISYFNYENCRFLKLFKIDLDYLKRIENNVFIDNFFFSKITKRGIKNYYAFRKSKAIETHFSRKILLHPF